jgi:hypothetical protein
MHLFGMSGGPDAKSEPDDFRFRDLRSQIRLSIKSQSAQKAKRDRAKTAHIFRSRYFFDPAIQPVGPAREVAGDGSVRRRLSRIPADAR